MIAGPGVTLTSEIGGLISLFLPMMDGGDRRDCGNFVIR